MNRRVLLVDDNLAVRSALSMVLKDAGFDVVEGSDGLDGLTKAKSDFYDAFVIDYKMPIMDGITLIKGLREMPQYSHHAMTLLTTDTGGDFFTKLSEFKDVHVLEKPVDHQQLIELSSKQSLFRSTA